MRFRPDDHLLRHPELMFVELIEKRQEIDKKENEALEIIGDYFQCYAMSPKAFTMEIYDNYIASILHNTINPTDYKLYIILLDLLQWYIYETNYGENDLSLYKNNAETYDISTPSKFFNAVMDLYKEAKYLVIKEDQIIRLIKLFTSGKQSKSLLVEFLEKWLDEKTDFDVYVTNLSKSDLHNEAELLRELIDEWKSMLSYDLLRVLNHFYVVIEVASTSKKKKK